MKDQNFNPLAVRFQQNIYQSAKGQLRLDVLSRHLREYLDQQYLETRLDVVDIGAGLGQMSGVLAEWGHNILLVDPAEALLGQAKLTLTNEKRVENCSFYQADYQTFLDTNEQKFDLVLCHAVMEWLESPEELIRRLAPILKPDGTISLMFYNRHSIVLRNAIRGNWRKVMSGDYRGLPNGLTPLNPILPADVQKWVMDSGMAIAGQAGVRVFHDYVAKPLLKDRSYDDLLDLELAHCFEEPYIHMARYVHYLIRKA